jgi:hypothetical protein
MRWRETWDVFRTHSSSRTKEQQKKDAEWQQSWDGWMTVIVIGFLIFATVWGIFSTGTAVR